MRINENIRIMRIRNSLSQSEIADKLGISKLAYGRIERGESSVTFERLLELCEIFGCTINELINISSIEVQHITGNLNLQSEVDNLVVMSKLQNQYDGLLKQIYRIHKEHFTHEILSEVKTKLKAFIENSNDSTTDGFVDDFFAFLQQIDDAKDYNDSI